MSIYNYQSYKKYVNDWVSSQTRSGHGQLRKMAEHISVSPVIISQVFRGDRELSLEQAAGLANFIGLNVGERNYFLALVSVSRAGTQELKKIYQEQLEELQVEAQSLKNRIKHQTLSNEDRATFYSHWYYSAIRLGVSIKSLNNPTAIADHLNLDRKLVSQVIDFLKNSGLIIDSESGFDVGPQVTHVGHDSPFVSRHHSNWRLQALQRLDDSSKKNLFYTGPMALSDNASQEIRTLLIKLIEDTTQKAKTSKSETLRCLNIDWFSLI
jgi:uncharacterized protein (TIGR02147 family)